MKHKFNSFNLKEEYNINFEAKSKEYKEIENYLFDYATYLNNNKLMVSFDFEEELFKDDHNKIKIRMKEVLGYLQPRCESLEILKTKLLIEDLETYYEAVKSELLRLCNLKTNAIKCFIRNVRSWLKNWEFKQEVLTDIKKLFVITTVKLKYKFDDARAHIKAFSGNNQ